jgi:3-deoxy-D-manno-octulosonate 8-phosphate phosphatase (KDO 8-P phosphatase)
LKNIVPLEKLKHIQLLLLDVDGVLTDGNIIYNDDGSETKVFNARDGFGLRLVSQAGIKVGIVTGRSSNALRHRCDDLGICYLFDGIADKAGVFEKIAAQTGINPDNAAFVGDDLPDLPIMKRAGLSIAVADAHEFVRQKADWTTRAPGGHGAVREVCEALLAAQGLWEEMVTEVY